MTTRRTIPITLTGSTVNYIEQETLWGTPLPGEPADAITARVAILASPRQKRGRGFQVNVMLDSGEVKELLDFFTQRPHLPSREAARVHAALTAHAEGA